MHGESPESRKKEIDALAGFIRAQFADTGICILRQQALSVLWNHEPEMSDMDKRLLVHNFAQQYGFLPVIDYGLDCAIFREG